MPINLSFKFKGMSGKTDKDLASFFFRSLEEKQQALLKFMKQVQDASKYYMTEDPEMGNQYIEANKNKASVEFLDTTASPELEQALGIAKDVLTPSELMEMLQSSLIVEPGSKVPHTNALYVVAPLDTLEVDLNQFGGKINAKPVGNLYDVLTDGLEQDHMDWVEEQIRTNWEGGTLYVQPNPIDAWQAVVDEGAFLAKLEKRLEKKKTA